MGLMIMILINLKNAAHFVKMLGMYQALVTVESGAPMELAGVGVTVLPVTSYSTLRGSMDVKTSVMVL